MSTPKRNRIIIDFDDAIPVEVVLRKVGVVVERGKVSEAAGIPHYCWGTTFLDGTAVWVRRKRIGQKSDSFVVSMDDTKQDWKRQ